MAAPKNDEWKTHLRGARAVLRSKTPDRVRQESYGLILMHSAIRGVMHEAGQQADEDPDRLSYAHAVRILPTSAIGPPSAAAVRRYFPSAQKSAP